MSISADICPDPSGVDIPLTREDFLLQLLRELTGTLQEVAGIEDASGLIALAGQRVGDRLDGQYRDALAVQCLDRHQVAAVIVDLKRRIQGDFYVIEESEERIVLGNRRCPFGESVRDRPSLCMLTSNVIGTLAAEHLGRVRVSLMETIARGDAGCRVVIWLKQTPTARAAEGRDYFGS
ncbi:MAG TPA: transcriptional regulator [Gammaproteobacteria bacterium]|nr:transcriptional regulator [Gammaproteobacteria bacterium]